MPRKNPETPIMDEVKDALQKRWHPSICLIYRINPGLAIQLGGGKPMRYAPKGWSDLVMTLRGHLVAFEVKTEDGEPEISQLIMQENWEAAGTPYLFVKSGKDAIEQAIKRLPEDVTAPPTEQEMIRWRASLERVKALKERQKVSSSTSTRGDGTRSPVLGASPAPPPTGTGTRTARARSSSRKPPA